MCNGYGATLCAALLAFSWLLVSAPASADISSREQAQLSRTLQALSSELKIQANRLEQVQNESSATIEELRGQLTEARKRLDRSNQTIARLVEDLNAASSLSDASRRESRELQTRLEQFEESRQSLTESVRKLRRRIWTERIAGFAVGAAGGVVLWEIAQLLVGVLGGAN